MDLNLCSPKGNHGVRYFPYSGFLGLTTLKVEGVVRTKLEPEHTLKAKSITVSVRCYETRYGLLGVIQSNVLVDYTQVLWSKPDDQEYAEIGDLELPFRICIPPKVGGFSTASYASAYKCSWRVEAIINHIPIIGVGSRQVKHSELPLLRFGLPASYKPPPAVPRPLLDYSEISHPHCPPIRYSVDSPTAPIGPLDLVSIPIHLLPSDSAITFRSASVIVERRMRLLHPASPPITPTASQNASPTHTLPPSHPSWSLPIPQRTSSSQSLSYSPSSSYQESSSTAALLPSDSRTAGASLVNPIAGADSSGHFARSESGVWTKTLTLQWPAAKSHSRWAIGETMESEMVSVKFFARVKIVVSTPSGTESLELEEKELLIVSTNEAERQLALSKYDDAYAKYSEGGRSKSKSPRRSRRQDDAAPPLPSSASRAEHPYRISSSAPYSAPPLKPPRRPHTSAGPRDKSLSNGSAPPTRVKSTDVFRFPRPRTRPHTDGDGDDAWPDKGRLKLSPPKLKLKPAPEVATTAAANSTGSASSTSLSTTASSSSVDSNQSDEVREWEAELARIELRSRRSSDLLGFASKRRRPSETTRY